jgi:hypothetical protein
MTVAATANPVTFDLHVELYPRPAIDRAVAAFAELGHFDVEPVGRYHRVTIRSAGDAAALGHEFANHVLSLAVVGAAGDEPGVSRPSGADDAP